MTSTMRETRPADPTRIGEEYFCGYWHKRYVVLAKNNGAITVRWEDGQVATHRTPWTWGTDLFVRAAPVSTGREYSADEAHWHFAPNIARQMARDAKAKQAKETRHGRTHTH